MKFVGIIPSRYASTRLPGKPLIKIHGKTMINHVYQRALSCKDLSEVVVATDDKRIFDEVEGFGGKVMMTSPNHRSGTERCNEVATIMTSNGELSFDDVVINIQGDEPFIDPLQISLIANCFKTKEVEIATLAKQIVRKEDLFDPNIVKVIINEFNNAIYFSRSPLPYVSGKVQNEWTKVQNYYKHIGIYAYRIKTLDEICKLKPTLIEVSESLEQLRWIANEFKINVKITDIDTIGIDTPEDLLKL
jgi:3-deoxy-manno-octulosonate cytidylyltransferase (CMP-KDO synthetase)